MGSLAEAMANVVQHIQAATAQRGAHLRELRGGTRRLIGEFRSAHRAMARELQEKLEAAERARGVEVSELQSDTHNLMQRFKLEHRDMGRTLSSRLTSGKQARIEATRQARQENRSSMNALRARLGADARTLHASLRTANDARTQAARQTMGAVAADLRQASRTWREELKKKGPPSLGEVTTGATEAIAEVAAATVPVQERPGEVTVEEEPGEVTVEEARGEGAVEEEQAVRVAARAERVLAVIQAHPDGIRLVEIGNEMGVDWRGLIAVVRVLMDEGKVEKIDDVYYPAQR